MQAPLIPLYKINQLRCFNCNQFLLCGPIHLNPNDGSSLCGRCRGIATNIFHNKAYEAIASIFGHPCVNWEKHCDQILLWNGNFAHENECTQPGCCICCKSSRKLPSDNGNALPVAKVPIEALEKLKCIFCYGFISCGPVLLTPDGENICNRCVATQENLYNEKRNLPYEMLAEILIFPCRYIRRGCPSSFKYGVDIFEHENHCDYRQVNRRQEPEREFSQRKQGVIKYSKLNDKKERGVIQTHAGHVFGTITPNYVPAFAPPNAKSNQFDINKDLIKSLQKKQHRQRNRVDDGQVYQQDCDIHSEATSISDGIDNSAFERDQHRDSGNHKPPEPSQYSLDINRLARLRNPRLSDNSFQNYRPSLSRGESINGSSKGIPRAHADGRNQRDSYQGSQLSRTNSVAPVTSHRIHPVAEEIRQFKLRKTKNPYKECNNLDDLRHIQERF